MNKTKLRKSRCSDALIIIIRAAYAKGLNKPYREIFELNSLNCEGMNLKEREDESEIGDVDQQARAKERGN